MARGRKRKAEEIEEEEDEEVDEEVDEEMAVEKEEVGASGGFTAVNQREEEEKDEEGSLEDGEIPE